jgi:hypothetical protein
MTAPKRVVQMAHVRVGYTDLLMPSDKALKLVEMLQSAVECSQEYEPQRGYVYYLGAELRVELALVKPSQLKQRPKLNDAAPLLLSGGDHGH